MPVRDFVRFMQKQAWRLQKHDPEKIPLGSFRIQVPGNPNAINAAICSGRFPGCSPPTRSPRIYPGRRSGECHTAPLLSGWLSDPQVEGAGAGLSSPFQGQSPAGDRIPGAPVLPAGSVTPSMRDFFPRRAIPYVDGGAIDNTPTNSAVDYVREWAERTAIQARMSWSCSSSSWGRAEGPANEARDPDLFQVVSAHWRSRARQADQ